MATTVVSPMQLRVMRVEVFSPKTAAPASGLDCFAHQVPRSQVPQFEVMDQTVIITEKTMRVECEVCTSVRVVLVPHRGVYARTPDTRGNGWLCFADTNPSEIVSCTKPPVIERVTATGRDPDLWTIEAELTCAGRTILVVHAPALGSTLRCTVTSSSSSAAPEDAAATDDGGTLLWCNLEDLAYVPFSENKVRSEMQAAASSMFYANFPGIQMRRRGSSFSLPRRP